MRKKQLEESLFHPLQCSNGGFVLSSLPASGMCGFISKRCQLNIFCCLDIGYVAWKPQQEITNQNRA